MKKRKVQFNNPDEHNSKIFSNTLENQLQLDIKNIINHHQGYLIPKIQG